MATRLMDKSVATWWDNLKFCSTAPVTWNYFVQKSNEQYYTHFYRDQKRQEFFRLSQFRKTVIKYETELRELAEFVLKLAYSQDFLCSKFEKGLTLKIRKKKSILGSQSYKEVVQLALRAKKLTNERMSQEKFQKRKGFGFLSGQFLKKSQSSKSSGNSSRFRNDSVSFPQSIQSPQSSRLGTSPPIFTFRGRTMLDKCPHCCQFHIETCGTPQLCF